MAVTPDKDSILIEIHEPDKVYPAVEIFRDKTGAPAANFFLRDPGAGTKGIWMKGQVKFSLDPGDTLKDWRVGFVQIVRQNTFTVRYSGRIGSEGSIVIDPTNGQASNTLLDCLVAANKPWSSIQVPNGTEFTGAVANARTQDNPHRPVPATLQNPQVSKIDNFLYDFKWDCEFWTMLTAMDPAKSPHYLAYIHWQFVHKVDFFWRTGDPLPSEWGTFKLLEKMVLGPPTDPSLQSILAKPAGPIANDIFGNAIGTAFTGASPQSRSESDTGLSPMRLDFWRENELPANVA